MKTRLSTRDEANAITAYAFRNTNALESLHAGKHSPLLDDPAISRITNSEMREIMIEASEKIEYLLKLRDTTPDEYQQIIVDCWQRYCRNWDSA